MKTTRFVFALVFFTLIIGCSRSSCIFPIPFPRKETQNRTALVIGNAAYKSALLQNAVTDAREMADTLEGFGYVVIRGEDLTRSEMEKVISSFGKALSDRGGVGLFYYAGHAGEAMSKNYLFPTDTNLKNPLYNAIAMNIVIDEMKNARTTKNIIIMDACRERFRSLKTKSSIRGLADMSASMGEQGSSFFIAYSTSPGKFASDYSGYTSELVKFMQKGSLKIEDVFKKVNRVVREKTKGRQSPWINYNLTDNFYFKSDNFYFKPYDSKRDSIWNEHVTGIEFVKVRGGEYSMGCEKDWAGNCQEDEKPSHLVQVDDFYMSKYEITSEQWNLFLAEHSGYFGNGRNMNNCKGPGQLNKNVLRNKVPIICISWHEADDFAQWLSAKTGKKFSLPTEMQWEYACRSGGKPQKFAGRYDSANDIAWYKRNSKSSPRHVGLNQPNGLGLYDMTGNAWEWCLDVYDKNAYEANYSKKGRKKIMPRVLRGGSFITVEEDLRCPNRWWHDPSNRLRNAGFRLVMTP